MKSGAAAVALALNLVGGETAQAAPRVERFVSGSVPIAAEWFRADMGETARRPGVLILHGADGMARAESYRFGAQALAASGFHVVLIRYFDRTGDARAKWSSLRQDAPLWVETIRDAVTYVSAQPEVDRERVAVVGFSLGASLALAASGEDSRIRPWSTCSDPCRREPRGRRARRRC